MIPLAASHLAIWVIVSVSVLLMLVRPRGIAEFYWVGGGAVLLLVAGLVPLREAGSAVAEGTDVYLFLAGMMLLAELAKATGVFEWLAGAALQGARGSSARLFALVYLVGTVITVCMSNDATAVVLTPAVLAAVRRAKVDPLPFLYVCALVANAASFVLPISNPANLVVFHQGVPPLGQWMLAFGLPSALSISVTYAVLRWMFRRQLRARPEGDAEAVPLRREGRLVLAGLGMVVIVLMAASALHWQLGWPACLAALCVAAALWWREGRSPWVFVGSISWGTLLLVAGLFVMVDAVEGLGALPAMERWLGCAQRLSPALAVLSVGTTVAVANNVVNNLPLGLLAGGVLQAAHLGGAMAQAVLIGVDLGPNLSVTGSLATLLWLLALRKEGIEVSFLDFLKTGAVAMPCALLAALGGTLIEHRLGWVR